MQLERLLGRYWVKLSTCRSALPMSEWPHAPERLYMFSAQRQETTQISTACPTNGNICSACTFLGQNFHCHLRNMMNCLWQCVCVSVLFCSDSPGDLHHDQPPRTFNVGRVLSLECRCSCHHFRGSHLQGLLLRLAGFFLLCVSHILLIHSQQHALKKKHKQTAN